MNEFLGSSALLLVLINPFLLVVYLVDALEKLDNSTFRQVLIRAAIIATIVFCSFALLGDAIFTRVMHVEFASFQIFGGIAFLLIGLQFMFRGPTAIEILSGESKHIAGAIAMPVLIGPGSISASVVIGKRHDALTACGAVILAVIICLITILLLKWVHDHVRSRHEQLIQRYIEIAGRITALYVGTVAIEMMMQGLRTWINQI